MSLGNPGSGSGGPRRRGSAILTAMVLCVVLVAYIGFQRYMARQSLLLVHRTRLATVAELAGTSAIEEFVDQVNREANQPGTELFRALRGLLDGPWSELDLKPFLKPPQYPIHPRWGGLGGAGRALETSVRDDFQARLFSPRFPGGPRSTEEFTALLTFTVVGQVQSPVGVVEAPIRATYEARAVLTNPPRPFDQVAVFLRNPGAITDLSGANQALGILRRDHEEFRQQLQELAPSQPEAVAARFLELAEAMQEPGDLRAGTSPLPGGADTLLLGPNHGTHLDANLLNLAGRLRNLRRERQELVTAFQESLALPETAAVGEPTVAGERAYALASALGRELGERAQFLGLVRLLSLEHDWPRRNLLPYFDRLEPDFFLQRVHLRLPRESDLLQQWSVGEARLQGVVEVEGGGGRLSIRCPTRGRLVLVTSGQEVLLEGGASAGSPRGAARGDHLMVVSLGAPVTVTGNVDASVWMLPGKNGDPPGAFVLRRSGRLRGSLLVSEAHPGKVVLEGRVEYRPGLRTPFPPSEGEGPFRTHHYTFVLSPTPIF